MSTPVWPSSLPQKVEQEGYQEKPRSQVIRSKMDTGPAKVRRRFTTPITDFQVVQYMSKTQYADLDTFYHSTLAGGALKFEWQHPRTGTTMNFRFIEPPSTAPTDGEDVQVTMKLEEVP